MIGTIFFVWFLFPLVQVTFAPIFLMCALMDKSTGTEKSVIELYKEISLWDTRYE